MIHNDSELGRLPTCPDCSRVLVSGHPHYCDGIPTPWRWYVCAALIGAMSALLALGIFFHTLAKPDQKEIRK